MQTLKEDEYEPEYTEKTTCLVRTRYGDYYKKVPRKYITNPDATIAKQQRKAEEAETFAMLSRSIRKELNITQKELATLLRVSKATVSNWEKKVFVPQFASREALNYLNAQRDSNGKIYLTEKMFELLEEASDRLPRTPKDRDINQIPIKRKRKILTVDVLFYATIISIVGYVAYHVLIMSK